jgi:hypothetical protein
MVAGANGDQLNYLGWKTERTTSQVGSSKKLRGDSRLKQDNQ